MASTGELQNLNYSIKVRAHRVLAGILLRELSHREHKGQGDQKDILPKWSETPFVFAFCFLFVLGGLCGRQLRRNTYSAVYTSSWRFLRALYCFMAEEGKIFLTELGRERRDYD